MSAFRGSLGIDVDTTGQRLDLAREVLDGGGSVLLQDRVALHSEGDEIECAVITRWISTRNPELFEREIEEAKELLAASTLVTHLKKPLRWIVVDDYGMGSIQVWPERAS